jgi:hypothetical protein
MLARLALTKQLIADGTYKAQAAAGWVLLVAGAIAELAHKIAEKPDMLAQLPPLIQTALGYLLAVAPIAELLIIVGGTMAAQGEKMIPKATPEPQP